jgi:transcriptional regulator with XRE-family HTH domain
MLSPASPKAATEADRVIGSRIAALRVAKGLSQTALGEAIGVSFQQVQKYEKGRNRIGVGRLRTIADLLKVPVETFFIGQAEACTGEAKVSTFLVDPKVAELVLAFTSISDRITRESVLSIVKSAAAIHGDRDGASLSLPEPEM